MRLIKQVKTIEVKRSFALTPILRKLGIAKRRSNYIPSNMEYQTALKQAKAVLLKLKEEELDAIVGKYPKRLKAYNSTTWYLAVLKPNEVGVWRGAGSLPVYWTKGSLEDTAVFVKRALESKDKKLKKRARLIIPALLKLKSLIKKDLYLKPIIFKGGIGTNGRKGQKKMKGDIDDGCMRSIAFAVSGDKELSAYFGTPKT